MCCRIYFTADRKHVGTLYSYEYWLLRIQANTVLLDVNVGEDDGRGMCKAIKAQSEYQQIPVILMSANNKFLLHYAYYRAATHLV